MSEKEFNEIFSRNIKRYMKLYELTQLELSKRLGVSNTSVSNWMNGLKTPRMDKVDKLCEIFRCKRSDLMYDHSDADDSYYIDSEAREVAEFLYTNPEYRVLFSACRDIKKEDIEFVKNFIDRIKGND